MHTLPNLSPAITYEIFADLCATLPPPVINTPEGIASRDDLAMAQVADMHPADTLEALLAVHAVILQAQAKDCLRLMQEYRHDFAKAARCRDQATAMTREMQRARRGLSEIQTAKRKELAASVAPPTPPAQQAAQAPAKARPIRVPAPPRQPAVPAALTLADDYALHHCNIAYSIRAARGLTREATKLPKDMLPGDPAILEALINGDSPILRKLDEYGAATVPMA